MSLYSIVVPVYNSEHTLEELYERLKNTFETVVKEDFELILVDDSSRDQSFSVMEKLRQRDKRVKIIQMAKNFGQHPALLCGFSYCQGDYIVTMDDDLQHPPEEIPKMINAMKADDGIDVIIAKYEGRKHNLIRKLGTRLSVYATSKMLKKDPNLEITSFRLIKRFIVDAIVNMDVHYPQIGNLLILTSNRIINVEVHHDARKYGRSNYTFKHLVRELLYDIKTNSALPLIWVRNIGIISFIVSVILALFYLLRYFISGVSVEGWTSIVLLTLAYNGLILLAIGIIGDYLMRILDEAKKMPNYTIRKKDL